MPDRQAQHSLQERVKIGLDMIKNGWTAIHSQDPNRQGEDYKWTSPAGNTFQSRFIDLPPETAVQEYLNAQNENTEKQVGEGGDVGTEVCQDDKPVVD